MPTAPDWADDERLDELFSAWAEAALAADVVTDRGGLAGGPEPAAPVPTPGIDASAHEPLAPLGEPAGPVDPQPIPAWSRSDDEIIPQPRGRRGRRRR